MNPPLPEESLPQLHHGYGFRVSTLATNDRAVDSTADGPGLEIGPSSSVQAPQCNLAEAKPFFSRICVRQTSLLGVDGVQRSWVDGDVWRIDWTQT